MSPIIFSIWRMVSSLICNQLLSNLFVATLLCYLIYNLLIIINSHNNKYTIETYPIDPFVLEGLPPFTLFSYRR